jgi:flagella basal body P-ring formation protein FlgA
MTIKILIQILGILTAASYAQAGISLKVKAGPFCSAKVSWMELLESDLQLDSIVQCLDEVAPVMTSDLTKTKLVSQLKNLKGKCKYRGSLQIPEKFEVTMGDRLSEEFIERSIASLPQYYENKLEIKIVRLLPIRIACHQIKMAKVREIKVEGKNFFRWTLPTEAGGEKIIGGTSDGGTVTLTGEFKVEKEVAVLKSGLAIGDRVSSDDWQIEKRDITFQNDVLSKAEEFEGRSLARGLVAGSMIRVQDLKREFLVEKNQMVKVQMGGGDFEITAMAIAESSGYQGDWVKLRNPETSKTFTGVAIAKGLVEVR